MTSGLKDNLVAVMTVLEDLCDLEATAITTYVTALKVSSDPETLALIEAESTSSKEFATTTEATIKAATRIVKTVSDKLDEKAAREHRVSHRALSQDTLSGEHHSDPPNKITIASDLKPEQLCHQSAGPGRLVRARGSLCRGKQYHQTIKLCPTGLFTSHSKTRDVDLVP